MKSRNAGWLSEEGPGYPLVLSSRARLARNLSGLPFPPAAGEEDLERARGMVLEAVSRRLDEGREWNMRFAEELSRDELQYMAEEHIVSPSFGERCGGRAVAISWPDSRSVVVNEEDHVRVQAVLPGARVMKAWRIADELDSRLESEVEYSFDPSLGYLTSSPGNVGTGLRVSAMLHLPALVTTGDIAKTITALGHAGVYVRGLYGENSGVVGNMFQLSNRRTLGQPEEQLVTHVETVVQQVADKERTARKVLKRDTLLEVEDRVYRALGVLERARKLGFTEALELVSLVKMGVEMELLPVPGFNLMAVAVAVCPYHLRDRLGQDADEDEVDRERAVHIRRLLDV